MQDDLADSAAPDQNHVAGSSKSISRRLPSRTSNAFTQNEHNASEKASKVSTKPQHKRHVSFNEFVHERIFSLVPAAVEPEQSGGNFANSGTLSRASSDGDSNTNSDAIALDDATDDVYHPSTLSQQQQEGMSAMLYSKIRLPPPPSPPDSPPRQAALPSSPKAATPKSPSRRTGDGGSGVLAKSTFESILTGISEGSAQTIDSGAEGVTEKELKLSHERIAENLRERLLSISDRLRDINVLEACHPAGAMLPFRHIPFVQRTHPSLHQAQLQFWRMSSLEHATTV
jgi:hypothetical protein